MVKLSSSTVIYLAFNHLIFITVHSHNLKYLTYSSTHNAQHNNPLTHTTTLKM
jgi:hypothetical protein